MRILMTADTVGGVWTYAIELARALEGHDVSVDLATMGAALTDGQREQAAAVPSLILHESDYKLEWMQNAAEDVLRSGDWLLELEREVAADVVHLNGYAHGRLPFSAPTMVVGHSCVYSWWQAVRRESPPESWKAYWRLCSQGLHGACMVVAPSRAMLTELQKHYGPLNHWRVIPNGRDPARFRAQTKSQIVFTSGRIWDEAKNIAAVEAIAPRLAWPVFVAGESEHPDGAGGACGVAGAACEDLNCLGKLGEADMIDWLGRAAIYVSPARYEPFGLSILEAAMSGCALVLGDIATLREIWQNAAVYVPPDDSEALCDAIERLIDNAPRRAELARLAQIHAARYTSAAMGDAYVEAYRKLIDSTSDKRSHGPTTSSCTRQ